MNDLFKKNVGEFILTFSEIEFELAVLVSYLENGTKVDPLIPEIFGLDLLEKQKNIKKGLKDNEILLKKWNRIDGKISDCNHYRRFIAHGIVSRHSLNSNLQGLIKAKPRNGVKGFHYKELTNQELFEKLEKLYDINAGIDGLGDLHIGIKDWINSKSSV